MVSIARHCAPTFGTQKHSRVWDSGIGRLRPMRSRDIVAKNINALMASDRHREVLGVPRQVVAASNKEVSNGTLGRVRNAENGTRLDTLDALAKTFDVEPWQLLVPGFDPEALPQLAHASLLREIRSMLFAEQNPTVAERHTQTAADSAVTGKKKPLGRLPGEVLRTGPGKGKSGEADRHAAVPTKRGRGRS